jgi:hypothetical protein
VVVNILREEAYITALGLHGLRLIKNLTPFAGFPCEEKNMSPTEINAKIGN